MKFRRPAALRTTSAIAGVAALASALAFAASPAKATIIPVDTIQWCDFATNNTGIDAWINASSTWLGIANPNECQTTKFGATQDVRVDFFLNNQGIDIGHVTFQPGETITVTVSGSSPNNIDFEFEVQ